MFKKFKIDLCMIQDIIVWWRSKTPTTAADPGGGAALRNDIIAWWGKQILKANMKKASSQEGVGVGVRTSYSLPLELFLHYTKGMHMLF